MTKRALEALQGSIKKWEDIRAGIIRDEGLDNCPLCTLYNTTMETACRGCPVRLKTCTEGCRDTPYIRWSEHHRECHKWSWINGYAIECPTCRRWATKELNFLKSLLPKGE